MEKDFVTYDEVKEALSKFYTKSEVYSKPEAERLFTNKKASWIVWLAWVWLPNLVYNSVQSATWLSFYNTVDQTTNFERIRMQWSSNVFKIASWEGGTATTSRVIRILCNAWGSDTDTGWSGIDINSTQITHTLRASPTWVTGHLFTSQWIWSSLSSWTLPFVSITPTIAHTWTAGYIWLLVNATETSTGSWTKYLLDLQVGWVDLFMVDNKGKATFSATNTAWGTTWAQTINKPSGTVNFAAAATSLVVTNSLVTTSSIVYAVVRTNDTTATIKNVVPWSGSFTINLTAWATAETSVWFVVFN